MIRTGELFQKTPIFPFVFISHCNSPIFRVYIQSRIYLSGEGESAKKRNITVQKIFFNCLIIQIKGEALTTGLQYIHIPHHKTNFRIFKS